VEVEKCSKEVGRFQGLFKTFEDLNQITGLSRHGKCDFKIQGLSRTCSNPGKANQLYFAQNTSHLNAASGKSS